MNQLSGNFINKSVCGLRSGISESEVKQRWPTHMEIKTNKKS